MNQLTTNQAVITLIVMAIVTYCTRALPFWLFGREDRTPPKAILYLGNALPYAIIAVLVIYCYRNIYFTAPPFGIPMLVAGAVVVLLQLVKRNNILSIFGGTAVYMILIRIM